MVSAVIQNKSANLFNLSCAPKKHRLSTTSVSNVYVPDITQLKVTCDYKKKAFNLPGAFLTKLERRRLERYANLLIITVYFPRECVNPQIWRENYIYHRNYRTQGLLFYIYKLDIILKLILSGRGDSRVVHFRITATFYGHLRCPLSIEEIP